LDPRFPHGADCNVDTGLRRGFWLAGSYGVFVRLVALKRTLPSLLKINYERHFEEGYAFELLVGRYVTDKFSGRQGSKSVGLRAAFYLFYVAMSH